VCAIRKSHSVATCKILKGKYILRESQSSRIFRAVATTIFSRFAPSSGRKRHPVLVVVTSKIGSNPMGIYNRARASGFK
jgi:hypothetical protein